jgi:DNA invertase Pin-like site-specific DNA recombinase
MTKRAALYLRVSTDKQSVDMQQAELSAIAERAGWQIVAIYRDEGISGAKGRDQRPQFDRMLKDATRRKFDVLMSWSVDRLGRSLQDLINSMSDWQAAGIDLYLREQAVDTTTPGGRALFQMMGVFAEFERAMIRQRVQAGVDRAKAKGKTLGRPRCDDAAITKELAAGASLRQAAQRLGISLSTVKRARRGTHRAPANLKPSRAAVALPRH